MISVVVTTYRELRTIRRALDALLPQLPAQAEVLVVSPDEEIAALVAEYQTRYAQLRLVVDDAQGKPLALNHALAHVKGDITVLTDGDVHLKPGALAALLQPFENTHVGAVSGRPLSSNPRDTIWGFWAFVLTDIAHHLRLNRSAKGNYLDASGYLLAFRTRLFRQLPADALAEDALISQAIAAKGFQITYAPTAEVIVKYPTNYRDWLLQKVRSAGGYTQSYTQGTPNRMRSPWLEALSGLAQVFTYPRTAKEVWWLCLLLLARIQMWGLIFIKVTLLRRNSRQLWQRVDSTK